MKAPILVLAIIAISIAISWMVNGCNSSSNNDGVPRLQRTAGMRGWQCAASRLSIGYLTYRSIKGTRKKCPVYMLQLNERVKLLDSLLVRGHCLIANPQTGEFNKRSDMSLHISRTADKVVRDIIVHDYAATKKDDDDDNIGLIKFSPPYQVSSYSTWSIVPSRCVNKFPPSVSIWIAEQVDTSKGLPCIVNTAGAGLLTLKSSPKAAPCIVYLIQLHPHIPVSSSLLTWGNCLRSDSQGALHDPADLKLRLNGGIDKNVTGTLVYDYTATGYHSENIGFVKFRPPSKVSVVPAVIDSICLSELPELIYTWIATQLEATKGWDCLRNLQDDGSLTLTNSPHAAKCSVYVPCRNCTGESDEGLGDVAIIRGECLFLDPKARVFHNTSDLTLVVNGLRRIIDEIDAYVNGTNGYTDKNTGLVKFRPSAHVKGVAVQSCIDAWPDDKVQAWIETRVGNMSEVSQANERR